MLKRRVGLCLFIGWAALAAGFSEWTGITGTRVPAIDRNDLDESVRPGDDFFRYTNGRWLDRLILPDDRSVFRTKEAIEAERDRELEALLEKIISQTDAPDGSDVQKIRDFYLTATDERKIEAAGASALRDDLDRINNLKSAADIPDLLAVFQAFNLTPLFSLAVRTDPQNTGRYALFLNPGALGLADREDYLSAENQAVKVRETYAAHIARMLVLLGEKDAVAAEHARVALAIETRLAEKLLTRLQQRDLSAQTNRMPIPEIQALCPALDWPRYFAQVGVSPETAIVANPAFLAEVGRMTADIPLENWKTFLRWRLVDNMADFLSRPFAQANFEFYGAFLSGQKAPRSRKERARDFVNEGLGEILGRIYAREYFPADRKARIEAMFANLKSALQTRIEGLDWMTPSTKAAALMKLETMRLKVGFPDVWPDYSGLDIRPDSFALNLKRLLGYIIRENLRKCGRPVDRDNWGGFFPHTANAGYMPLRNQILFPAAILRPPFFYAEDDDAVNYGGIGFGLAHEMMHAFDDQGRRYDKDGNLRNWWTPEDEAEYKRRAEILVGQYASFKTPAGTPVDARLSMGENLADIGGLTVAWDAYRLSISGTTPPPIDGFASGQRFFLAFAKLFRGKIRPEALARMMKEDKHPWGEFRVNGAPFHLPDFYRIFDIRPGEKLFLEEARRLTLW